MEWCACFVSWCADQCGYIDTGVVPKYAGCVNGVQWFKDRGQWIDGSAEPVPGMIIFFDWDNKGSSGPQDGQSDHTGIVQKVENGIVYIVEGNSGDSCRVNQYSIDYKANGVWCSCRTNCVSFFGTMCENKKRPLGWYSPPGRVGR